MLRWKFLPTEEAPEAHLSHVPRVDTDELARTHEFVPQTLRERVEQLVRKNATVQPLHSDGGAGEGR